MAQLLVKQGPHPGAVYAVEGERASIGRDQANDICVPHLAVSRSHAELRREDGGWILADLGSSNGTFLNGERIEAEPLSHLDEIRLGDLVLTFIDDAPLLLGDDTSAPEITQTLSSSTLELLAPADKEREPAELERRHRGLLRLFRLSNEVSACHTLPDLMTKLTQAATEALGADRVVPITLEARGELRPWFGRRSAARAVLAELPISRSVVDHVRKHEEAVRSEVQSDERFRESPSVVRHEIGAAMCVPLVAGGRELGVIYADRIAPAEPFDRHDLEMLAAMAMPVTVAVENLRSAERLNDERDRLVSQMKLEHNILGRHPSIRAVLDLIERVAPTDTSVLIIGESGTGKELVARAIHLNSPRSGRAFEAVNCAALAPNLLESELFGHVKGAFTGAIADKPGRFELAHQGTLFLDEIGEMPLDSQAKLLRVIEHGELRRVGDTRDRDVDVRILAATNKPLEQLADDDRFRKDLFFRLNIVRIDMPPLRTRGDDIDLLADHFLEFFSDKCGRKPPALSTRARELLNKYPWPGNVRELKNVMERLAVICRADEIKPEDLPPEVCAGVGPGKAAGGDPTASLADLEKEHILRVIGHTGGNKKEAAAILGIDRSTLYAKLKSYGIE
jgi:transcriptional regulator with GAF, ATPase, and Fis domain